MSDAQPFATRVALATAVTLAVVALGGCSSAPSSTSAAAPAATTPAAAKAPASPTAPTQTPATVAPSQPASPAAAPPTGPSCSPTRDVIVRYIAPGLPANSQVLGDYDVQNCTTTFESLKGTSPTEPGFCTEAAWASDNPGYDADATPSAPLKKIQVKVGPAC